MKTRLLDLFSCAGGAAMGYHRAGFEVVGVDNVNQRNYPFEFHQADALEYLAEHGDEFDVIHASPPCQGFTAAQRVSKNADAHLDLVTPIRPMLEALGKPYVIENVPGAPLRNWVQLCGSEFGLVAEDVDGELLQLRRHRWFESNVWIMGAGGCRHMSGVPVASVYGHGGGWKSEYRRDPTRGGGYVPATPVCRALMGIDWRMTKRELSESIPPAFTQHIGAQVLAALPVRSC